jgi:hypothetical protein
MLHLVAYQRESGLRSSVTELEGIPAVGEIGNNCLGQNKVVGARLTRDKARHLIDQWLPTKL